VAERHLRRLGYIILARQWRDPQGEVDLIAVDQQTVVFVEVKTRRGHQGGHPLEAISAEKQRRLCRAALTFLRRHGLLEQRARFDAIAVTWPQGTRRPTVEHVRGAFEPTERWQMFA
jgi:putative endonuclease